MMTFIYGMIAGGLLMPFLDMLWAFINYGTIPFSKKKID